MDTTEPSRISRREAIQWVIAAGVSAALMPSQAFAADASVAAPSGRPYGTDPLLNHTYRPGELWPLTLGPAQRGTVIALCDLIIPADDRSPSASAVGVPDFIDEWISAPYAQQAADRAVVLDGLKWIDAESARRFGRPFAGLDAAQQAQVADDIAWLPKARPEHQSAATFFALFRDLATTGFYTTPAGMKDIGFIGNVALAKFPDPPKEALAKLGLA